MSQLDPRKTGQITESMFVKNIKKYYSDQELSKVLNYDLIPSEILAETNMQASVSGSLMNMNNNEPVVITIKNKHN